MSDQVAEVKQKTDIVSLINEYIELKKAGRNYKTNCPFHSEKTPSFNVSPELQIFKCFGCGIGGDVYSFLQEHEGMEFYEALKFLADRAGVKLESGKFQKTGEKERLYQLNNLACKFYQYILLNHSSGKVALSYLTKDRGLKIDTIKTFKLGYSPDVFCAIKKFLVEKKKFKDGELEKAGIVYRTRGGLVDRFRGRVIFPLFDHRGNVAGFAGRVLPSKGKSRSAKYINSPETPVYYKSNLLYGLNITRNEIKKRREAIVVEGELDLISSWQAGVKNVVALKGSAFTQNQARLLGRFAKKTILALDADVAGDAAVRRGIGIAESVGLEVRVAKLVGYKDPDDIARKDAALYKKILTRPIGVWDFILDSIFSKYDLNTGTGKAKVSREVVPILASILDKIVQAHYVELVAKKLKVPTEAVIEQVAKVKSLEKSSRPDVVRPYQDKKKSRQQLLEDQLLALAFRFKPKYLLKKETRLLVKTPLAKRILEEFKKYSSETNKFDPAKFASDLPKELVEGFNEMVLKDTYDFAGSRDKYKKELKLVTNELKILNIKLKLKEAALKIGEFEKAGQNNKLESQEKRFARLSRELAKLKSKLAV